MVLLKKRCPTCKLLLPRSDFYKYAGNKDGLYYQCKKCSREAGRRLYAKNPAKMVEKSMQWVKNNPDKHKSYKARPEVKKYFATFQKVRSRKLVQEFITAYGSKCACCGES